MQVFTYILTHDIQNANVMLLPHTTGTSIACLDIQPMMVLAIRGCVLCTFVDDSGKQFQHTDRKLFGFVLTPTCSTRFIRHIRHAQSVLALHLNTKA